MRPFSAKTVNQIDNVFLEVAKLDRMKLDGTNENNIYFCIYPYVQDGGVILIWNLTKLEEKRNT